MTSATVSATTRHSGAVAIADEGTVQYLHVQGSRPGQNADDPQAILAERILHDRAVDEALGSSGRKRGFLGVAFGNRVAALKDELA